MASCRAYVWLLVMMMLAGEAGGQACCSGGSPISSNVQALVTGQRALHLMLSYEYNDLSDLQHGTERLSVNNRHRATHATLIRLGYSTSGRLALFGLFSAIWQLERNTDPGTGHESAERVNGPGDLLLMGQYALLQSDNRQLTFSAGMKLPTGATDHRSAQGILLAPDLQPGTGSLDVIMAVQFAKNTVFTTNGGMRTLATFRISNHADRLGGLQTYKFGNEIQIQAGYYHDFYTNAVLLSPDVTIRLRHAREDLTDRATTPNTGGSWLSLIPAIGMQWPSGLALQLHSELPLFRDLQGIQLTTSYRVGMRVTYQVPLAAGQQD